jgi:hypothetical protein
MYYYEYEYIVNNNGSNGTHRSTQLVSPRWVYTGRALWLTGVALSGVSSASVDLQAFPLRHMGLGG